MVPAQELGLRRVWVDREHSGHDASIVTAHIHDMASLPATVARAVTALEESIARYVAANPASARRAERAAASLPGGEHAQRPALRPVPARVRARRGRLPVLAGRRALHGLPGRVHGRPLRALAPGHPRRDPHGARPRPQLRRHTELEGQLAELLSRASRLELVRFTNSGTEANLMALALARPPHGPRRDPRLPRRLPRRRARVRRRRAEPGHRPARVVIGDYNAVESTRALIRAHELAAILVEPMLGSGGCIPASREFLAMLREEATRDRRAADLRRGHDVAARPARRRVRRAARPDDGRQVPRRAGCPSARSAGRRS